MSIPPSGFIRIRFRTVGFLAAAFILAITASQARATVTLTASKFYLESSNDPGSTYKQLKGHGAHTAGMYIVMGDPNFAWDNPNCFLGGNPITVTAATRDEAIRQFLLQIWSDRLTYEEWEEGEDHGNYVTKTRTQEFEQLRGWLRQRIADSVSGFEGTPIAYTIYYDYVEHGDYDSDGNWHSEGIEEVALGLDGYTVLMSGSEEVTPIAPQFIDPENSDADGRVIIPAVGNLIYRIRALMPGYDEGEDPWEDISDELSAGTYYYPIGSTLTVTAQLSEPENEPCHLSGNAVTEWTHFFKDEFLLTPVAPQFIDPKYEGDGARVVIPALENVTYYVNGDKRTAGEYGYSYGQTITVTVEAEAEYHFLASAVTTWTHQFLCPVIPPAPNFADGDEIFVEIPYNDEGWNFTYRINGEAVGHGDMIWYSVGDSVTVTVEPASGYYFPSDVATRWMYVFQGPVRVIFDRLSVSGQNVRGGGWSVDRLSDAPAENVEVRLDGNYLCDATMEIERYDVAGSNDAMYYCGFSFELSAASLSNGEHTIEVIAYSGGTPSVGVSRNFRVNNGVAKIEVVPSEPSFHDGMECAAVIPYQEDENGDMIVEAIYRVNGAAFTGGDNWLAFSVGDIVSITVEPANGYYFPDNTVTEWTHLFQGMIRITFEQISQNVMGWQNVTGSGWTVNTEYEEQEPAEGVEVWLDGRYLCNASVGVERTDIVDLTGKESLWNSGFNFSFPASGLFNGEHTVEVRAFHHGSFSVKAARTFTLSGGVTAPVPSLNITAIAVDGQSASGGGILTVYAGETVTVSSTATSTGWLSEHNIKGYTSGTVAFSIPNGASTLSATATTTFSARTVSWTPTAGNTGTHTLYAEAFIGISPGNRIGGVSGWPAYVGGPFGGLPANRLTVDVRNSPAGILQLLDAQLNPVLPQSGTFTLYRGDVFYVRISGSDADGDADRYYSRIARPDTTLMNNADALRDTGNGSSGSKTFGPFMADSAGDWRVWGHVSDGTAREWASLDPWNENGNGWWFSPHYTLNVVAPPMSVTAAMNESSIEYGQSVIITSAISMPAQNMQWHGMWITPPGEAADYSKAAAWMSRDASGGASTLSGTFAPPSAGQWMIHANGQETSGAWGPGADKTLTVGKTTPTLTGCASITLSSSSALAAWHLAAHADNPHNPNAAAPPVIYTIIAGGKGNAPNGTVLAPARVLPSGTYTVKISTPETESYNAAAQNVTFTVKSGMTPTERLHSDLGLDPDAVVRPDTGGEVEADVYTPAR